MITESEVHWSLGDLHWELMSGKAAAVHCSQAPTCTQHTQASYVLGLHNASEWLGESSGRNLESTEKKKTVYLQLSLKHRASHLFTDSTTVG